MSGKAIKPQTIRNTLGRGGGTFTPGKAPSGGFQAIWNFSGRDNDYKNSPVAKPERNRG